MAIVQAIGVATHGWGTSVSADFTADMTTQADAAGADPSAGNDLLVLVHAAQTITGCATVGGGAVSLTNDYSPGGNWQVYRYSNLPSGVTGLTVTLSTASSVSFYVIEDDETLTEGDNAAFGSISSFTTTHPIEYTTNTSDELVVGGYQIFGSPGTISSSGGSSILKIATGDIRHIVYDDIATATTDDLVCTSASNANASAFLISYERSGGSGPITGNITQVTENESLFNMQIDLDVSVGQVTENESLFGPTADTSDSIAVGQVTENESVFDPTFESSVSILINQVTENESMFGATLDSGATVDITQVVENESVFNPAVVSTVSVSIAQINETESLFTVDPLQGDIVLVGQVTENESVFSGSIDIDLLLGLLTEEERVFGATIPGLITYLNINDAILGKTGGPTIADGLATWFSKGANESLQDAERRWLLSFGATTSGTNQDLWNQYLTSLGYSGTFNDKYLEYWKNV